MTSQYRMSAEDKLTMASALMECPAWCDGTLHVEGVASEHVAEVGEVGSVYVTVVRRDEDPQGAGVCLDAERIGGRNILHAEDLAALRGLIADAEGIAAADATTRARVEV